MFARGSLSAWGWILFKRQTFIRQMIMKCPIKTNLIKIRSTHLLPVFYRGFIWSPRQGSKCVDLIIIRLHQNIQHKLNFYMLYLAPPVHTVIMFGMWYLPLFLLYISGPVQTKLSFLCCSANSHYGLRSISLSNTVLFWNRMVAVYSIYTFICHYAGKFEPLYAYWGRHGHDRMVVGFITT